MESISFPYYLTLALILLAGIGCWVLTRRLSTRRPAPREISALKSGWLDVLIVTLCFAGLFLTPMHIRTGILKEPIGEYRYINWLCAAAMALSLLRIRRWSWVELLCFCVWLLLLIPLKASDPKRQLGTTTSAVVQLLFPLFLTLYRMNPDSRRRAVGLFLVLFDVFIAALLVCGVVERLTGNAILAAVRDWLTSNGWSAAEYIRYIDDNRFGFIWGHTLTNAIYFNAFYVLNIAWFRAYRRRCPSLLFFAVTLAGVLLSSAKFGLIVCFVLLVITHWKQKNWLLAVIPVLAVLYFAGAFNRIIYRFTHTTFSTDRLEELQGYLASGVNPLRFFPGYGIAKVLKSSGPVYAWRHGFEFPLLMHAYNFGILFSVLHVGGLGAFATWRFLREKNWLPWVCWGLLFAEINIYNAFALLNQDMCYFFCLFTMLMLNIPKGPPEQKDMKTAG